MRTGSLCPHCRPSWKCLRRRSHLAMLLRHPPLHCLLPRACLRRSVRPRHPGRLPTWGARTRTRHRGRCTPRLRPFRARTLSRPLRTLPYLPSQAGRYLHRSTHSRDITRRLPSSLSRPRPSRGTPKRNLTALVTVPRRHHTRFPVCIPRQEGFPPGSCRYLPIRSPRDIAPVPGFPRPTKHGARPATERRPIIRLTVHPTTRRLSTSTFKQTGTKMLCKR